MNMPYPLGLRPPAQQDQQQTPPMPYDQGFVRSPVGRASQSRALARPYAATPPIDPKMAFVNNWQKTHPGGDVREAVARYGDVTGTTPPLSPRLPTVASPKYTAADFLMPGQTRSRLETGPDGQPVRRATIQVNGKNFTPSNYAIRDGTTNVGMMTPEGEAADRSAYGATQQAKQEALNRPPIQPFSPYVPPQVQAATVKGDTQLGVADKRVEGATTVTDKKVAGALGVQDKKNAGAIDVKKLDIQGHVEALGLSNENKIKLQQMISEDAAKKNASNEQIATGRNQATTQAAGINADARMAGAQPKPASLGEWAHAYSAMSTAGKSHDEIMKQIGEPPTNRGQSPAGPVTPQAAPAAQAGPATQPTASASNVKEEDIQHTMKLRGMTREQVMSALQKG